MSSAENTVRVSDVDRIFASQTLELLDQLEYLFLITIVFPTQIHHCHHYDGYIFSSMVFDQIQAISTIISTEPGWVVTSRCSPYISLCVHSQRQTQMAGLCILPCSHSHPSYINPSAPRATLPQLAERHSVVYPAITQLSSLANETSPWPGSNISRLSGHFHKMKNKGQGSAAEAKAAVG